MRKLIAYIQPFLVILHSDTILKINQSRIRVQLKDRLLRFLIINYQKFKVTTQGAALYIDSDLSCIDEEILRYRLLTGED